MEHSLSKIRVAGHVSFRRRLSARMKPAQQRTVRRSLETSPRFLFIKYVTRIKETGNIVTATFIVFGHSRLVSELIPYWIRIVSTMSKRTRTPVYYHSPQSSHRSIWFQSNLASKMQKMCKNMEASKKYQAFQRNDLYQIQVILLNIRKRVPNKKYTKLSQSALYREPMAAPLLTDTNGLLTILRRILLHLKANLRLDFKCFYLVICYGCRDRKERNIGKQLRKTGAHIVLVFANSPNICEVAENAYTETE